VLNCCDYFIVGLLVAYSSPLLNETYPTSYKKINEEEYMNMENIIDKDTNFEKAFNAVLENEGGYVNDPDDKGGETKYGISKNTFPKLNIKGLTIQKAKDIYYNQYWLANRCNRIEDYDLAFKLFDLSVNLGAPRAAKLLQKALACMSKYVEIDGLIGPETLGAIKRSNPKQLLVFLQAMAANHYLSFVEAEPSQKKFLKGWMDRVYA
jgi:lysozyme family protein